MSTETLTGVGLVIVALLFAFILRRLSAREVGHRDPFPYRKEASLLTPAELGLLEALRPLAAERGLAITMKVRLADVLIVPRGIADRRSHLNRLLHRHLDFVLCDPATLEPRLAVSVSDAEDRRHEGDDFLEHACTAAGLPLLKLVSGARYEPSALRASLASLLPLPSPESAAFAAPAPY